MAEPRPDRCASTPGTAVTRPPGAREQDGDQVADLTLLVTRQTAGVHLLGEASFLLPD